MSVVRARSLKVFFRAWPVGTSFLILFFVSFTFAQDLPKIPKELSKPVPQLIEGGPYVNSETASLHIDILRNAMDVKSGDTGVIFFFCGSICGIGEVEANLRGIYLALKGKGVTKEIQGFFGGYRKASELQYWAIPKGASFPRPRSTITIENVEFYHGKWKNEVVAYDCCDQYEWPIEPEKTIGIPLPIRKELLDRIKKHGWEFDIGEYRNKVGNDWKSPDDNSVSILRSWTVKDKKGLDSVVKALFDSASPNYIQIKSEDSTHLITLQYSGEIPSRDRSIEFSLDLENNVFTIQSEFGSFIGTLKKESPIERYLLNVLPKQKPDTDNR